MMGKKIALILMLAICRIHYVFGVGFMESGMAITESSPEKVVEKWTIMKEKMREVLDVGMERLNELLENEAPNLNISYACNDNVRSMLDNFIEMKVWALHMFDSFGKPVGGQLTGSSNFGSRDLCLDVVVPLADLETKGFKNPFSGQYCYIDMRPPLPETSYKYNVLNQVIEPLQNFTTNVEMVEEFRKMAGHVLEVPYRMSICLPSTCSEHDILKIFKLATDTSEMELEIHFCELKELVHLRWDQIFIMSLLCLFMLTVLSATLTDIKSVNYSAVVRHRIQKQGLKLNFRHRLVRCFSAMVSLRNLFSTELDPRKGRDQGALSAAHGIRFFAMTWILLGQTAAQMSPYLIRSTSDAVRMFQHFAFQYLLNTFLAVDTFFFLSALMVSYHVVRLVDSKQRAFNVVYLVLKRIWRLLPGAMLMLGLFLIFTNFNNGPMWKDYWDQSTKDCIQYWWMIPTFTLNIFYPSHQCLKHLWFISAEMQLFLIAMVYFLILFKSSKAAKLFLLLLITASVSITAYLAYTTDFPPSITAFYQKFDNYASQHYVMYFLPHVDLCVYAIGLGVGTYLARAKQIRISIVVQGVGWFVAVLSAIACAYLTYFWSNGRVATVEESVTYTTSHRTVWALCLSWFMVSCGTGRAEILNSLMSWPGFVLLNKQSYMSYLLHYLVLTYFFGAMQGTQDLSGPALYFYFFSNLVSTFVGATVLNIFFGEPMANFPRLFFGDPSDQPLIELPRTSWKFPAKMSVVSKADLKDCVDGGANGGPLSGVVLNDAKEVPLNGKPGKSMV